MKSFNDKPIILTFIGNYLPGYKAGGILRTIANTVDYLCDDFDFRIVTRDRDLGEDIPYACIKPNQWNKVGNAVVFYLQPQTSTVKDILNLLKNTPHDVVYLNSFFDPLTVKVLLIRKFGFAKFKHIIVAPRGEFAWGSLGLKYPKKFIYIQMARLFGFYNKVIWQASSEFEVKDIIKIMKVKPDTIRIARDLPNKVISDKYPEVTLQPSSDFENLKVVFLSRIAREKRLDYALNVLSKVKTKVIFDIYGPAEDTVYWKECQELMNRMPDNVKVNYFGSVNPGEVGHVFSQYDLFLLPTAGENYGHVIIESLTAGTPVLISNKTSWRNLQADGLGWDIDLTQMDSFVKTIENFALLSYNERLKKRAVVKAKIIERLLDPTILEGNRQLFKGK
ncbi:MAG: glycosyltransferase family 4 protein [bacterium]